MNSCTKPVVLTFVGNYVPGYKAGGIVRTIVNAVDHLCDEFEFKIVTRDRDLGDDQPYPDIEPDCWQRVGNALVRYVPPRSTAVKDIRNLLVNTPHHALWLNSFFDPLTVKVLWNIKLGFSSPGPVIVAPRGEFAWASLKQKYPKKLVFMYAARLVGLYDSIVWHASSQGEALDITKVMRIDPGAIQAMDDFPIKSIPVSSSDAVVQHSPEYGGALRVVFLSRIAREKNLDYALRVLSRVDAQVAFDIYGPAPDVGYWKQCKELINHLPANVTVNYLGNAAPDQVVDIFSRYDLFLFPTGGEAYGHVIAECLTAGTPVLVSTETPWRNLQSDGLGWDVDLAHPEQFVEVIEHLAVSGESERREKRIVIRSRIVKRLLDPAVVEAHLRLFGGTGGCEASATRAGMECTP